MYPPHFNYTNTLPCETITMKITILIKSVCIETCVLRICLYLCVFVYCRSLLSFLVYVFTVNTVLFAALDAK